MSEPLSGSEGGILGGRSGSSDVDFIADLLNSEDKEPETNKSKGEEVKLDDKIDLLETDNKDEDKIDLDDKGDKKGKDKEDTTDEDELEEDKDKDKNKDEELDEEVEVDAPPRKKEILAKFPDLFKPGVGFPWLEKMMYRDKRYTELFGSFDDAKEVAEKVEVANRWEKSLLEGDLSEILSTVKKADPKAFDKTVDNYLTTLAKVDKEAYFEVAGNVAKKIIIEMVSDAKTIEDPEEKAALLNVAKALNKFMFSKETFEPIKPRVNPEEDKKENDVEKERRAFLQERFDIARTDVQGKVDNTLKATIAEYIDKGNKMTDYVKKNAVREALEEVHSKLGEDKILAKNLEKLWKFAFDNKFNPDALKRIQSTYLGKAKLLLPSILKDVRARALKDLTPRKRNEEVEEEETPQRGSQHAGRPSQQRQSKTQMEKGESIVDFFERD